MPLRGFKNVTLEVDPKAKGTIERGWIKVTLSCGHSVKDLSARSAWHAALLHARRCQRLNDQHTHEVIR